MCFCFFYFIFRFSSFFVSDVQYDSQKLSKITLFFRFFFQKDEISWRFPIQHFKKNKKINNFHVFRSFLSFYKSISNRKSSWLKSKLFLLRHLERSLFSKSYILGASTSRKTWIYKCIMNFSLKNSSSQFWTRVL